MKTLFDYFLISTQNESEIVKNKARALIWVSLITLLLVFVFIGINISTQTDHTKWQLFLHPLIIASALLGNLWVLRKWGLQLSGNILAFVLVFIEALGVSLPHIHTGAIQPYLGGFYIMLPLLVLSAVFASRRILAVNALLFVATALSVYLSSKNVYQPPFDVIATRGIIYYLFALGGLSVILLMMVRIFEKASEVETANLKEIEGQHQKVLEQLKLLYESRETHDELAIRVDGIGQSLSSAAAEQASSLEQISVAMDDIAKLVDQNADRSANSLKVVNHTTDYVRNSEQAFFETIQNVKAIDNAIGVVSEIAQRTQMLSINAAIEAARAGAYGKGFAVVAYEIRKLAEKSAVSAEEIAGLVTDSKSQSEKAEAYLKNITAQIIEVQNEMQAIAQLNHQQRENINEMNRALNQVNEVSQANVNDADRLLDTMQLLVELSDKMRNQLQSDEIVF